MAAIHDSYLQEAVRKLYSQVPEARLIPPDPDDTPEKFTVPKFPNPTEYYCWSDRPPVSVSDPAWLDKQIVEFGVIALMPMLGPAYPELCVVS